MQADPMSGDSFRELTELYAVLAKAIDAAKAEDRRLSCDRANFERSKAEGDGVEPLRKGLAAIEKSIVENADATSKNLEVENKVQEEATAF